MYDYYDNDRLYYVDDFQWRLDVPYYEIDERTWELLRAADMLQDYRMSLRQCSRETGIPRSTLQSFIHDECRSVCSELAGLCRQQFRENRYRISDFMYESAKWRNYKRRVGRNRMR